MWLRWWFEIINASNCVLGYAYSLSQSHTESCIVWDIGDNFTLYFTLNLCSKLEENKQRFVKHWDSFFNYVALGPNVVCGDLN